MALGMGRNKRCLGPSDLLAAPETNISQTQQKLALPKDMQNV